VGDKGGRQVGVISEPTVDVLNLPSLIRKAMSDQGITIQDSSINDDVELFAVAASDGLMDFMKPIDIAEHVTHGLYSHGDVDGDSSSSKSLEEICEQIILEASNVWLQFGQRYRDDITIAVSKVEV
jgi:serine/threonine protein phosphatase PrpC